MYLSEKECEHHVINGCTIMQLISIPGFKCKSKVTPGSNKQHIVD